MVVPLPTWLIDRYVYVKTGTILYRSGGGTVLPLSGMNISTFENVVVKITIISPIIAARNAIIFGSLGWVAGTVYGKSLKFIFGRG